jgi:hypothetical protein
MKSTHNLKIVVLEIFRNSKYHVKKFNFKNHLLNVNGS